MISHVAMSRAAKREVVPWRSWLRRSACGAHRQEGLGTVQGLDLALFVDTENQGTIRRAKYRPTIADLLHEEGIARQLEGLRAMRLQAEGPPDAMNGRGRVAARPRHRAKAPMGRVRRRLFQRQPDPRWRHRHRRTDRRGPPPHATPLAHGVRARLETNGDQPFRRRQAIRARREPLRSSTRQRLQFGALVIAQRDRHRPNRALKTNRDIITHLRAPDPSTSARSCWTSASGATAERLMAPPRASPRERWFSRLHRQEPNQPWTEVRMIFALFSRCGGRTAGWRRGCGGFGI